MRISDWSSDVCSSDLSVNTIAAKLGQDVGFHTVADMARRFGITTPIDPTPAMVLGTSEVHLIDMTRAFASVANKGVAVARSEERRVGKECVSTCRSRWSPSH